MRKNLNMLLVLAVLLLNVTLSGTENKKLAQTGFQFLSVTSDARAAALAGAVTTLELGSSSLFFNPAGMAQFPVAYEISASQNKWIADINHYTFSLAWNPFNNRYGVFGLSVQSVDYGEIQGTMVWANEQGYIDTEIFRPSAYMVGFGYAKALSDMFSIGGQLKYTSQHLGNSVVEVGDSLKVKDYKTNATAFDFGTIFNTGYKSIAFGMSIRNFSDEIEYEKEGFQLPLTFSMGISMDLFEFLPDIGFLDHLYCSIDAVHPRSYPEYINLGFEYKLAGILLLRYGYLHNRDQRSSSFGFGISRFGATIDYSYTPFSFFQDIQRFTIRFSF
ncbi:MAG: PorV/PorQ family protein [Candidatus Marinimicrobia bacterium]|nr:PorV/PorQ family protein [Candidatus Neomarinimicrobiota bacterium]